MIFNFTNNYQFTTRLKMNNENIDVIDTTRLLGTVITNDLSWGENVSAIVRKSNARMEILRRISNFSVPLEDMKTIYILFIRSLLEQSATVWHSSLSQQNVEDLERVQKSAFRVILQQKYKNYKHALQLLEMDSLYDRREKLCLNFAQNASKIQNLVTFSRKRKKHIK